jgi:hypothetical protein
VLVGYDLEQEHWIAKNSWGSDFADNGFFRVKFGAVNVATPHDTYALVWDVPKAQFHTATVRPADRDGCYFYTATSSEPYLTKLAQNFGLDLNRLLLDNIDVVTSLDAPIVGSTFLLCGVDQDVIKLFVQTPSPPVQPVALNSSSGSSSSLQQVVSAQVGATAAAAMPRSPPARLPTLYTENGCTCKAWTRYGGQTCNYSTQMASGPWCAVVEEGCDSSAGLSAIGSWDYVEAAPKQVCQ